MQNILSHLPNTHFAGLNNGNSSFTFPQKISILKYALLKWTVQLGVLLVTRDFSSSSDKANGISCSVPLSLCDGHKEALLRWRYISLVFRTGPQSKKPRIETKTNNSKVQRSTCEKVTRRND